MLLATQSHTPYDILVGLHVAAAIVGFGAVALSGVYGGSATRPHRDGALEELRRYFTVPTRAELLITVVPVLGVVALLVQPGPTRLGQLWVAVALVLWVIASVLLFVVVRPAEAVIRREVRPTSDVGGRPGAAAETVAGTAIGPAAATVDDPGGALDADAGARLRTAGSRLRWSAAASDLVFFVALVVMVIKPGS
jgi:hypothetical protein